MNRDEQEKVQRALYAHHQVAVTVTPDEEPRYTVVCSCEAKFTDMFHHEAIRKAMMHQAAAVLDALTPPEGVDTAAARFAVASSRHHPDTTVSLLAGYVNRLCDELDRTQAEGEWEQVDTLGELNDALVAYLADFDYPTTVPGWERLRLASAAAFAALRDHRPAPTKGETP